jgi:hypothetical protein
LNAAVVIDHSYHRKTGSTRFFHDFLRTCFEEVIVLWDESWSGAPPLPLELVNDRRPDAVFFSQVLYKPGYLAQLRTTFVYHIPMYDGVVGWSNQYWLRWRDLRFICFSSTLHRRLSSLGMASFPLQYFPEAAEGEEPTHRSGIFWPHRSGEINEGLVAELFRDFPERRLTIHETGDPGVVSVDSQSLVQDGWKVDVTRWLTVKESYIDSVRHHAVFIAPRPYEGIGFTFLEAMSLGLCVVAPDQPTMNEYIQNLESGILYDFRRPAPIRWDELDLEGIGQAAKVRVASGRERYQKGLAELRRLLADPAAPWPLGRAGLAGLCARGRYLAKRVIKDAIKRRGLG